MHDEKFDEQRGKVKEFGGSVERGAGEVLGDDELKAQGARKETEGKAQGFFGKAKNAVGDAVDNVKDALDPNNKDPMLDETTRRSNDSNL